MPEAKTLRRALQDKREGKAPSTQAGEFVREEIRHTREGVHGARSTKQAIAIGLSKARRAGVRLAPPKKGHSPESARQRALKDYRAGQSHHPHRPMPSRSRAALRALCREGRAAASSMALARHAHITAQKKERK